ncbi:MAG: NAD-dependent epimerase/dehydratase family protein [Anaerolineae bacterium]|nr:NAD-dependent epimerase/dehydratase family protein [Anaerolineae bacterium]MDW8098827.1 NAD-dependent epimerase/dehydratase family protein [Anaerolineae bacterium]
MRVLITGGAGFLGSALARRLIAEGHHVRVLDDLSSGDPSRLPPGVLFTRGDVRDRPKLWTLLQGVQCVFHLAARVSVAESVAYPREYTDVNVSGTVALMEAVRDVGVRRVVLASSGTVYGDQPHQPVDENMRPNPLAPYAVSKIAAEYYVFTLGALYNVETVALRIFNAYGPGQALPPVHAPVIPQFLKQTLSGESLVIFGDGLQTRDFVYVDDVVDALIAAATAPGVNRQIINIGSGQEVSINALVRLIAEVTGRRPSVLYNEKQSGGVSRLVANLEKAHALLNYEPRVDLRTGLQRLLAEDDRFRSMLSYPVERSSV